MPDPTALAEALDRALPQTQCRRCDYPDCHGYAQAIAEGLASINQCPPGGQEGVRRLARICGQAIAPLNPANGVEAPRRAAVIDEAWCIGCTLCIQACPVDCIVGAGKQMHTVIEAQCTGCDLCIPVCPVDCIAMVEVTAGRTGWDAWTPAQADASRERYAFHRLRAERDRHDREERLLAKAQSRLADLENQTRLTDPAAIDDKRAVIEAALARARAKRAG